MAPPVILLCKWHPKLASALLRQGARVFIVLDDFDVENMHPVQQTLDQCEKVYRVSTMDSVEELSAVAVDLQVSGVVVDRVVSHVEFGQFGASYLDLVLRPGHKSADAHIAARDKRLMKSKVAAAGVEVTRWESVTDLTDADTATRVAERLSFPAVVKPVAGLGSMNTTRVDSEAELAKVLADFSFEPVLRTNHLMVEEFVPGRELMVEGFWQGGKSLFLMVCEYYQPRLDVISNRNENGPSDGVRVLTPEDYPDLHRQIRKLHDDLNGALEIQDGPTHLEVFERPDGHLVFSEIATRPGGFYTPNLSTAHLGRDYWDLWAEMVVGADVPAEQYRPGYLGAVHLTADRPGEIVAMPDDETFAAFGGALDWGSMRSVGDRVEFAHAAEWCAFVVLAAETRGDYDELAARAARELRVVVR